MKARCDICKQEVSPHSLETVLGQYETREVKELCYDCARDADKLIRQVQGVIDRIAKKLRRRAWLQWLKEKLQPGAKGAAS